MEKHVYPFGGGRAEGNGAMKDVLGGKGAGLAEMTNAGLPVPPGFTIATSACRLYFENGNQLPETIRSDWQRALEALEKLQGQRLGDRDNPLLVSVRSGNNARAITYRRMNKIPDTLGTAVNVQTMVFGNMGETSGTGVGFTRDPATGAKEFYGEFLMNAQGEDVVAGVRTPVHIRELQKIMPEVYNQLRDITTRLEKHYRDMQDFEFTIQDGKLYMLQTRNGKRTGIAAVKVAIQMVNEGLITKEEAIVRVEPNQLYDFLVPSLDEKNSEVDVLATV